MNNIVIKMVDNFSGLPIEERPFDIPTIQYERSGEFVVNGKSYAAYHNKSTHIYEYIHEVENHRENKGYRIINSDKCFTLDDIKEFFSKEIKE